MKFFVHLLLFAPSPALQVPESPTELLERAGYAREHRHDLALAEELYQQALLAARASADPATEESARIGLTEVLTRQGKSVPDEAGTNLDIERALALLKLHQGQAPTSENGGIAAVMDLLLYGAPLVPHVLQSLQNIEASKAHPAFGVYLLAKMDNPAANAAIEQLLASPDPLLRNLVVGYASRRHQALLVKATTDLNQEIAERALDKLSTFDDRQLLALMAEHARAGNRNAQEWMAREVPVQVIESSKDWKTSSPEHSKALVERAQKFQLDKIGADALESLVVLGRKGEDWQKASVREMLTRLGQIVARESVPIPLAATARKLLESGLDETTLALLLLVSPTEQLELLTAGLRARSTLLSEREQLLVCTSFNKIQSGLQIHGSTGEQVSPTEEALLGLAIELTRLTAWEELQDARDTALKAVLRALEGSFREGKSMELLLRCFEILQPKAWPHCAADFASWLGELRKENSVDGASKNSAPLDARLMTMATWYLNNGQSAQARDIALELYVENANPQAIATLLASLNSQHLVSGYPLARTVNAIEHLALLDPTSARLQLEQHLRPMLAVHAPDISQVRFAAEPLSALPEAELLALVSASLPQAKSPELRERLIAVTLSHCNLPDALPFLLQCLTQEVDLSAEMTARLVQHLADALYEPAIPALGLLLMHREPTVRQAARSASDAFRLQREALEEYQPWTQGVAQADDAIAELSELLQHPSREVRLGAVQALGIVRARSALADLVKLLADADEEMRRAVQAAIEKIGE